MRFLFLLTVLMFAGIASADDVNSWTDSRGNTWTLLTPRTTFYRAQSRCHQIGMHLAVADDFFEAADEKLFEGTAIDWVWVMAPNTGLSFRPIAWKYNEVVYVPPSDRHWALCEKRRQF